MNFEILVNEDGNKYVLFENGSSRSVNVDSDGKEYFYVPNQFSNGRLKLFVGRIKDAVQTIRDGDGDVLSVSNLFGRNESVIKFVDRKYGESLRAKSLEGFEDAEFGFSLKFTYSNSMSGGYFVLKNRELGLHNEDYIYYNTETEAEAFKQELLAEANKIINDYKSIEMAGKESEIEDFVHNHHQHFDVVTHLWEAIAEKEPFKLETVQVIKMD